MELEKLNYNQLVDLYTDKKTKKKDREFVLTEMRRRQKAGTAN